MPPLARNTVDEHVVGLLRGAAFDKPGQGRACCRRRRFCHPAASLSSRSKSSSNTEPGAKIYYTLARVLCRPRDDLPIPPTVPSGRTDHRPREGVRARLHKKRHGEGVFPLQPVAFTSRPAQDQLADKNRANSGSRREAITMPCGVVFYTVYG